VTSFAELLREYRRSRSLSQRELAERARLAVKAVGALEQGTRQRPYPHTVRALADALRLDDDERTRLLASIPDSSGAGGEPRQPATTGTPVPIAVAPVLGRDEDAALVADRLRRPGTRIVTLTGPGGVGKTTLSMIAAARVQDAFPGGVVPVDLSDVTAVREVMPTIACALRIPEEGTTMTAATVAPYLAQRRILLVLDNLEQVHDCGPELAALVASCPELVVLATSRVALRVRPEQEIRLAPLPPGVVVDLFLDRVRALGTEIDGADLTDLAARELYHRTDGLPLAVELAASAVGRLGLSTLMDGIDIGSVPSPRDLPARQHSMAATLAWSYNLLGPAARALLARLSVFADGFDVPAVLDVAGTDPADALTAFAQLVDHSIVSRAPAVGRVERFRLLVPIREDAAGRIAEAEREDALIRLSAMILHRARGLRDDLRGSGQSDALDVLDAELGNVRVALRTLIARRRTDDAVELLHAIYYFLSLRRHTQEGLGWSETLVSLPMSELGRARLLTVRAGMWHTGTTGDRLDAMRQAIAEGLALAERIGGEAPRAEAMVLAMSITVSTGDLGGSG